MDTVRRMARGCVSTLTQMSVRRAPLRRSIAFDSPTHIRHGDIRACLHLQSTPQLSLRNLAAAAFAHLADGLNFADPRLHPNHVPMLQPVLLEHLPQLSRLDEFLPLVEIRRRATGPFPLLECADDYDPAAQRPIDRVVKKPPVVLQHASNLPNDQTR